MNTDKKNKAVLSVRKSSIKKATAWYAICPTCCGVLEFYKRPKVGSEATCSTCKAVVEVKK